MNRHIAIVEDDEVILANYIDLLQQAGFKVDSYTSKESALQDLLQQPPELVLLDITIRGERDAGFHICGELRRRLPLLPIVFLTSHDAEIDKISALRLGADDYITKDASFDFLIVRIEALFRRRDAYAASGASTTGTARRAADNNTGLAFDNTTSTVRWHGQRVNLTLTQYWILRELCEHQGRAKSHLELMQAAKIVVEPNTIIAHVKAIRDSFREVDPAFDHIRTERGRGYRWLPS